MASSNRIYYAIQALQMKGINGPGIDSGDPEGMGDWLTVTGVQSVGISTNFNLENVFQLGEFDQYDVLDDNPEIEVTVNRVIDYNLPLYVRAMGGAATPPSTTAKNILELASRRCNARLAVGNDRDFQNITGTPTYVVEMTGMYLSSFTFNFVTDGNFTEEVTLVGNNKVWFANSDSFAANALPSASPDGVFVEDQGEAFSGGLNNLRATGIARRQNLDLENSVLPTGLTSWDGGIIMPHDGDKFVVPHISSLTVSCDLGREPLNELGSRNPYTRLVTVPLEITSEFTVLATDFDVSASNFAEAKCNAGLRNGRKRSILLRICGPSLQADAAGMNIYLGTNNRLTSVNYSGGDTGGGNVEVTYSFTGYNTCFVNQGGQIYSTITAAPYYGVAHNPCGRTVSNLGSDTASADANGGGEGTEGTDPGSTASVRG
jgi:hypothetical protein